MGGVNEKIGIQEERLLMIPEASVQDRLEQRQNLDDGSTRLRKPLSSWKPGNRKQEDPQNVQVIVQCPILH